MKERLMGRIARAFRHPTNLEEPMTAMEITGMTMAGTALAVLQVMLIVFITYYYTNVVGINAALVGTLLLVTRVADALSDLAMGVIIGKTRSKHGRARPWAARMALPLLLAVIVTFCVPEHWGIEAKTAYACVTYFLLITVALTPAGIVGAVLGTTMTSNAGSREKHSIVSTVCTMLGSVAGTFATLKITEALGDTYAAWRGVAVAFGVLACAGQMAQFMLTKERDAGATPAEKKADGPSLRQSLPALIKNKYFIIMCCVGVFTAIDSAMAGCGLYYFKYVLNNAAMIGVIGGVTLIPTIAGVALVPIITKKIPVKTLILCGLVIKVATFAINALYPQNLVLFLAFAVLRALAGAPLMVYAGVYLLNTIEYGEFKTGVRASGLIVTVSSVGGKIGSGIGGALTGWLLAWGGYAGTAAAQTASAQNMIVCIYFVIPLIMAAVQCALLCFYNLDKQHAHIVSELKERRDRQADASVMPLAS